MPKKIHESAIDFFCRKTMFFSSFFLAIFAEKKIGLKKKLEMNLA